MGRKKKSHLQPFPQVLKIYGFTRKKEMDLLGNLIQEPLTAEFLSSYDIHLAPQMVGMFADITAVIKEREQNQQLDLVAGVSLRQELIKVMLKYHKPKE